MRYPPAPRLVNYPHPDLRRRQSDALGLVHHVEHALGERAQGSVELRDDLCRPAQGGVPKDVVVKLELAGCYVLESK